MIDLTTATKQEVSDFVSMAPTAELLAAFNLYHDGETVKRFSSRTDGQLRVIKLAAQLRGDVETEARVDASVASTVVTKPVVVVCPTGNPTVVKFKGGYNKETGRHVCPKCGADHDQTAAGLEGEAGADRLFCHLCGTEYHEDGKIYKAPKASAERGAAIAASWSDDEVRKARATRHAVLVDKVEYRSVRAAFVALGLPLGQHISFRMQLKAEGTANAYGKKWAVIEVTA